VQRSELIALFVIAALLGSALALRPFARRHNLADRIWGTGLWGFDLGEERPTGRFSLSFRRTGVQPTAGGCGCLIPLWMVSRLKWQAGPRTWTVQVRTGKSLPLGTTVFRQVVFERAAPSKEEGQRLANEVLRRLRAGELDHLAVEAPADGSPNGST